MGLVILDIDETILHASPYEYSGSVPVVWEEDPGFGVKINHGDPWHVALRPSCMEFINELTNHYRVIFLTQGIISWQTCVFKELGLDDFISEIYGWNNITRSSVKLPDISKHSKLCMIDNRSHRDILTHQKANWLGVRFDRDNFIHCADWVGEEDHEPLTDHLDRVMEILS